MIETVGSECSLSIWNHQIRRRRNSRRCLGLSRNDVPAGEAAENLRLESVPKVGDVRRSAEPSANGGHHPPHGEDGPALGMLLCHFPVALSLCLRTALTAGRPSVICVRCIKYPPTQMLESRDRLTTRTSAIETPTIRTQNSPLLRSSKSSPV